MQGTENSPYWSSSMCPLQPEKCQLIYQRNQPTPKNLADESTWTRQLFDASICQNLEFSFEDQMCLRRQLSILGPIKTTNSMKFNLRQIFCAFLDLWIGWWPKIVFDDFHFLIFQFFLFLLYHCIPKAQFPLWFSSRSNGQFYLLR